MILTTSNLKWSCLFSLLFLSGATCAQCPVFLSCPSDSSLFCDYSSNDGLYWNTPSITWNPDFFMADLPEAATDLRMVVRDSCGGTNLQIEYTLFLDLDGKDTVETVVRSSSPPPSGKVLYNNILSPNYALGDPADFDHRTGLPDSMLYRFGLEIIRSGDSVWAQLRWTTGLENLNYFVPQLPNGRHRILWRLEQGGVEQFCEYTFEVKDCAPPEIGCFSSLSVNILPQGYIHLWASDLFNGIISDNITPADRLLIGARKASENGIGFPLDSLGNPITYVVFRCNEAGFTPQTHVVELWVRDKAGNTDSCLVTVSVGLALFDCNIILPRFWVCAETALGEPVENVIYNIDGTTWFSPPFHVWATAGIDFCGKFKGDFPCFADFTVAARREDNPLNGVTTYDLVLISKHILGITQLDSPFKMIAADVNRSGSVTTFDIVQIRKLILGIVDTFPNHAPWRFVDKNYVFPNPLNPFQTVFPDTLRFVDWDCFSDGYFTGIKVGDVNFSAIANATSPVQAETRAAVFLELPEVYLKAGEFVDLSLTLAESHDWLGMQFELFFDPEMMDIQGIVSESLSDFDRNNWAQPQPGRVALSWSAPVPGHLSPGDELLRIRVKAHSDGLLSSAFKTTEKPALHAEAYDSEGEIYPIQMVFSVKEKPDPIRIFSPSPNPTTSGVRFPLQLAQAENLRLELRDLQGKLCWATETGLNAGNHTLEIPASAMSQTGLYLWRVQAGTRVSTGKITRI